MEGGKTSVTSNECQILLTAIQSIQSANTESHKDLRDLIEKGLSGVQKNIDANAFVTNEQLKAVNDHLTKLNGSVAKHEKIINERKDVIDEFHSFKKDYANNRKEWTWAKKNWLVISIGFLVLIGIIVGVYDAIGLRGLMSVIMK